MDETSPSRSAELGANQSTKQLLDELDALMQRMLALPVDEPPTTEMAADAPVAAAPAAKTLSPTFQPPPALNQQDIPIRRESRTPALVPVPQSGAADKHIATPLVPMVVSRGPTAPQPVAAPVATMAPPKQIAPPPQKLPAVQPVWLKPSTAPKLLPTAPPPQPGTFVRGLMAINWIYDGVTHLFGPLGRWLRGVEGRGWVGWTGIAMLIGAAAWAAFAFFG